VLRGLQTLVNNGDKEASAVYDKLLSILENSKKEKIIKKSNTVVIDISPFEMQKEVSYYYKQLHKAIEEKRLVSLKYYSMEKGKTTRIIEPIMLMFKAANWYLYAYCREKQDVRCFKLLRIQDLEVLNETFEDRNISIEEEFNDFFSDMEDIEIVLKTDKVFSKFLQEFHYVVNVEEHGKDVFVTVKYPLNTWVYSVLLGFGNKATVVSPEHVKLKVIQTIKEMKNLYKE
jgi:predicted DNA-binding transcriptional regulator YafY